MKKAQLRELTLGKSPQDADDIVELEGGGKILVKCPTVGAQNRIMRECRIGDGEDIDIDSGLATAKFLIECCREPENPGVHIFEKTDVPKLLNTPVNQKWFKVLSKSVSKFMSDNLEEAKGNSKKMDSSTPSSGSAENSE